jgi:hypothetical protein
MNATIVGNIIGSNVMGGEIIGAKLHIGFGDDNKSPRIYSKLTDGDTWKIQKAPSQNTAYADSQNEDGALYVDEHGNVVCNNLIMYGGEINVGGFHVYDIDSPAADGYSGMTNFGETDLVGPVHIYGNLGVGYPNNYNDDGAKGNFYQTHGLVAMGIREVDIAEGGEFMGQAIKDYHAPFRLDSKGTSGKNDPNTVEGNFWPMHFHCSYTGLIEDGGSVSTWFTTMDIFKAPEKENLYPADGGHNYFRVSEWGTSAIRLSFRQDWLPQEEEEKGTPMNDKRYASKENGYVATMGPAEYAGDAGENNGGVGFGIATAKGITMNLQAGKNLGMMGDANVLVYSGMDDGTGAKASLLLSKAGDIQGGAKGGVIKFLNMGLGDPT